MMTDAEWDASMAEDGYVPTNKKTMNDSSSWADTINSLGQTAGGIVAAVRGPARPPSTSQRTLAGGTGSPFPWQPFAIIGGVIALVVVLIVTLKK